MVHFGEFVKPKACSQTVLPDWSFLKRQKLVENATIEKPNCDILSDFQTLWSKCKSQSLEKLGCHLTFFKVEFTLSLHRKYDGSRQKQEREGSSNLYHDFLRLREPPRDWQRLASLTHHLSGNSDAQDNEKTAMVVN